MGKWRRSVYRYGKTTGSSSERLCGEYDSGRRGRSRPVWRTHVAAEHVRSGRSEPRRVASVKRALEFKGLTTMKHVTIWNIKFSWQPEGGWRSWLSPRLWAPGTCTVSPLVLLLPLVTVRIVRKAVATSFIFLSLATGRYSATCLLLNKFSWLHPGCQQAKQINFLKNRIFYRFTGYTKYYSDFFFFCKISIHIS